MIILALDGLEYAYVKEFDLPNLKLRYYGKTNISEFSEPRTIVIWSSFLAGKNLEKEILSSGGDLWSFKLPVQRTFLRHFPRRKVIDMPGFNFRDEHKKEREALKLYFEDKIGVEDYEKIVFKIHKKNLMEFRKALRKEYDLILAYFNLADAIGHLSFGIKAKMRIIYEELDRIASMVKDEKLLIISDHGMKAVGRYGDHTNYGYWASNWLKLRNPRITEIARFLISKLKP